MKKRKAFTLAELCIAMVLLSMVTGLAVGSIKLTGTAFTDASRNIRIVRSDAAFASRLNETIRETSTAFTIPQNSFTYANLTEGWSYMGIKGGVHIPAEASLTGEEIPSERAIVLIEYAGDEAPASVPANANLIETDGFYFIETVIAHDYTDTMNVKHEYSLVFEPTDPGSKATQTIKYNLEVTVTDLDGGIKKSVSDVNIDTMLASLNAVQMVYQGSESNPATAIAFRGDFLPTYSVENITTKKPKATVLMILDLSGSMDESMGRGQGSRIAALKESAKGFINSLSENDQINVFLIPFSTCACNQLNYSRSIVPSKFYGNANTEKNWLTSSIDSLSALGGTNVGDGIRFAYSQLNAFEAAGNETGQVFVILMTDGAMNAWSVNAGSPGSAANGFYYGSSRVPPYVSLIYDTGNATTSGVYLCPSRNFISSNSYSGNFYVLQNRWGGRNQTIGSPYSTLDDLYSKGARSYMAYWAGKFVTDYGANTFLLSLCNGMSDGDKEALSEAFKTSSLFDINSLTDFQETFDQINVNMNDIMWAFEGPRI